MYRYLSFIYITYAGGRYIRRSHLPNANRKINENQKFEDRSIYLLLALLSADTLCIEKLIHSALYSQNQSEFLIPIGKLNNIEI